MLRDTDRSFLEGLGLTFEAIAENGMICVVIKDWPLPAGYQVAKTDLLIRLPPQFPDAPPDMFWMDPPVQLATGAAPQAAEVREQHLGRIWQRFSRHLAPGVWQPGRDSLQTYLALVRHDLTKSAGQQ